MFDLDLHNTVEKLRDSTSSDMRTLAQATKILRRDSLLVHRIILQYISTWLCCSNTVVIPTHVIGWSWNRYRYPPASLEEIVLSVAQTIIHNTVGNRSQKTQSIPHHLFERETPLSLCLPIKMQMQTGKKDLADMLAKRGICVSYDQLRQLSTDISNSVIASLGTWKGSCTTPSQQWNPHHRGCGQHWLQPVIYYCLTSICTVQSPADQNPLTRSGAVWRAVKGTWPNQCFDSCGD